MAAKDKWRDEFVALAHNYCELGATNADLAEYFEVTERTIERWCASRVEFREAVKIGGKAADERVKHALYTKALSGDTGACIFWLKNRCGWRDRVDHAVSEVRDVEALTEAELDQIIIDASRSARKEAKAASPKKPDRVH